VPLEGAIVMPLKVWQEIPADVRPGLLEATRDASAQLEASLQQWSDDAVAAMERHGLTVHHVPPDVVAEWERAARAGYPNLVGGLVPKAMAAEVERLRDEYRASHRSQP
jgi:TRAP-type C4-dicarboxylate transport system substrate-binding protein